jgi:tRNA pseudouridine32 synthase / 23S rRNA pseudouridine746 synthase
MAHCESAAPGSYTQTVSASLLPMKNGVSASCVVVPASAAHEQLRLLDFFVQRFPHVTREQWRERFAQGEVRNESGVSLQAQALCRALMKVFYYRSVAHEARIPFEAQVLYADAHLVVADKPHFLPVTPSGHYVQETLLALNNDALVPLHRIDRDTAGLVMFSAQVATRGVYEGLFRERKIVKTYEAIAPYKRELVLPMRYETRLVPAPHFMQMQQVEGAPNSVTDIELIEQREPWARYKLAPLTGRRHQLRVQMLSLGVPILNDGIYPELTPEVDVPDYTKPLQLIAKSLAFNDPLTAEPRQFHSARSLAWPQY